MPSSLPDLPPLEYGDLPRFLAGASDWIDRALPLYLPEGEPRDFLYDLVSDYPGRGGKRFRPALLLLCTALVGGDPRRALPSALALELFQNFALIHDDIEDGSHMRRGRPALHRLHGVPLALNAGDLTFGLVYEALLENERVLSPPLALQVLRDFSQVFRRTFEGQAMDIGWVRNNHLPSREEFEAMIRRKTGWYSGRGPCQIGALIGAEGEGKEADAWAVLGEFGENLGIGFQLRDDVLNLIADSAESAPNPLAGGYGKERGGDIAEGKRTLIVIEMMERLPPGDGERLKSILTRPAEETTDEEVEWAIARAEQSGALAAVRARCAELGDQARRALEILPATPQRTLLEELSRYLILERDG